MSGLCPKCYYAAVTKWGWLFSSMTCECSFSYFPFDMYRLSWDNSVDSPAIPNAQVTLYHFAIWCKWQQIVILIIENEKCEINRLYWNIYHKTLKYDFFIGDNILFQILFSTNLIWLFYSFQVMILSLNILSGQCQSAFWSLKHCRSNHILVGKRSSTFYYFSDTIGAFHWKPEGSIYYNYILKVQFSQLLCSNIWLKIKCSL